MGIVVFIDSLKLDYEAIAAILWQSTSFILKLSPLDTLSIDSPWTNRFV